ncbi:MAG: hypothetical protein DRJ30_07275 [Candidatus Methanomethylicota archaeon]|nr:MAG: hypothetical protein DRJ30_07275 [Candidatus Verstraetearchaeota archaeon]
MTNKLKQVKFYLNEEQYKRIRRLAEQQGLTVPSFIKNIVLDLLGEVEYGDIITRIKQLEVKYEQLAREIGRIEKELALMARR